MLLNGLSVHVLAQQVSDDPTRPHFEVASIKENKSVDGPVSITGIYKGDRLTATRVSVAELITLAYRVQFSQLVGGPPWLESDRFDIAAKADADAAARSLMLPMLQTLLEDRFQLRTHRSAREMPVFALAVAKNGPLMKQVPEGDCEVPPPGTPPGAALLPGEKPVASCGSLYGSGARVNGRMVSMEKIRTFLEGILGRKVIDRTGLTGYFDFDFQWTPDTRILAAGSADSNAASADLPPSAVTAIQEQLGLTVKSTKAPVEMLIIDHVERPSAN